MGVSCKFYTVYGVKHGPLNYEEIEEPVNYHEDKTLPRVISVDMDGNKYVVGKVLFECNDLIEGPNYFVTVEQNRLNELRTKCIRSIEKNFPELLHLVEGEWKVHSFIQFS